MLPPSVIDWQLAVKLMFLKKVIVVKNHDDWVVHSQKLELPVPSIVMTTRYVKPRHKVGFNRKMIYLRDNYTCQYCGDQFAGKDLTLDHVKPKSQGGPMGWKNIVTCCGTCNWMKGAKALDPLNPPIEPTYWQMIKIARQHSSYTFKDPAWAEYLGYESHGTKVANG